MKKRISFLKTAFTISIAAGYFLTAADFVFPLTAFLRSRSLTPETADFPCARHNCRCKTAQQCRTHCCCLLRLKGKHICSLEKAPRPESASPRDETSFLNAGCYGVTPQDAAPCGRLGPHTPAASAVPRIILEASFLKGLNSFHRYIEKDSSRGMKAVHSGGQIFTFAPGGTVEFGDGASVSLSVPVPVYQDRGGEHPETDFGVVAGLRWRM